jgi:AcrR family transcriptional regulator
VPETPARRGRRPGRSVTREAVLDAARKRFAADGFTGATIRGIAAEAGVDAALVIQFFRSKDELFGAVMSISPEALAQIADAFRGPTDSVGERVARAHLTLWNSDSPDAAALLAMLRGAIANEQANAQLRQFLESRLAGEAQNSAWNGPDGAVRLALAAAMLVGIALGRQAVGVAVLAGESTEALVSRVGPALQRLLVP